MKFTKKIGMMAVAIMLITVCSGFAELSSEEAEAKKRYRAEDFEYTITDDGKGIRITAVKDYNYKGGVEIIIPATIEDFPVTEVELTQYLYINDLMILKGFECPSNIKRILFGGIVDCDLRLLNCRELYFNGSTFKNTTLELLKEWSGARLVFNSTNIEKVIIQNGFSVLRDSATFTYCNKLTEVVIPETITRIEFGERKRNWLGDWIYDKGYQFKGCKNLSIKTQARLRQLGYEGEF